MQGAHIEFTGIPAVLFLLLQAALLIFIYLEAVKFNSKVLLIISILLSGLCVGMRFNYGLDTQMYTEWIVLFGRQDSIAKAFLWSDHEKSFIIISYFLYKLTGTYRWVFVFYSTVTAFFFLTGLWNFRSKINVLPGLLYYIIFLQWNNMCNIMRQALAISIVFWALKYVYKRSSVKFLFAILVAFCFHSSALAALPILFYGDYSFKWKKYLVISNGVLIALLTVAPSVLVGIMAQISERYQYALHYKFGVGFIVNVVILYILYKYGIENYMDKRFEYMVKSLMLLATILLISDYTIGEAARFREYYNTIYIIGLGAISSTDVVKKALKSKKIYYFDAIAYGYPLFYFLLYLKGFLGGNIISFSTNFVN